MLNQQRRGISLVEVLVVFGLIGLLVSLILPAILAMRASALNLACQNNLANLSRASLAYAKAKGFFPENETGVSWHWAILPFLDLPQTEHYASDGLTHHSVFVCPLAGSEKSSQTILDFNIEEPYAVTSYGISHGLYDRPRAWGMGGLGINTDGGKKPGAIEDGLAKTLMLVECIPSQRTTHYEHFYINIIDEAASNSTNFVICTNPSNSWTKSDFVPLVAVGWDHAFCNKVYENFTPGNGRHCMLVGNLRREFTINADSYHAYGVNVAMGDGSVHHVTWTIDREVWAALGTAVRGDLANAPW